MMRRPWSQPVNLNQNTGHGAVDVLTWASSALRTLSALRTTLAFATKTPSNHDDIYLQLNPKRQWLTADEVLETSIQPLIRIRQKPPPPHLNPASFRGYWVMYELFSVNERHPIILIRACWEFWLHLFFPWKTNSLFVFGGKLSRTATCCDTDLNVAQARGKTGACLEDNVDARAAALATQIWDTHVSTNHKPQQEPEHNNISQTSGWFNPKKHWKTVTHVALIAKSFFFFFPCLDSLPVTD